MKPYPDLKPFKTFREQAQLLIERGMTTAESISTQELEQQIERDLSFINYYRLSAYWYPYRKKQPNGALTDSFKTKTYWELIRGLYMFDRQLRTLIFDAISRIEIALRTQIAHIWAKHSGVSSPQANTNYYNTPYTLSKINRTDKLREKPSDFSLLLSKVDSYFHKVHDDAAKHHINVYGIRQAKDLPVWVFVEYTTFGNLASLLSNGLPTNVVSEIARNFGISNPTFFISCINLLNDVRNACAHQGRIWNRYWLTSKGAHFLKNPVPIIPVWAFCYDKCKNEWVKTDKKDAQGLTYNNYQTAAVLTIIHILLRVAAPQSRWKERLVSLLSQQSPLPEIQRYIGFTSSNWHLHPLWETSTTPSLPQNIQKQN